MNEYGEIGTRFIFLGFFTSLLDGKEASSYVVISLLLGTPNIHWKVYMKAL